MGSLLMYKLGTLEQYQADDLQAKQDAGWTPDEIKNGKVLETEDGEHTVFTVINLIKNGDEHVWPSDAGDLDVNDVFNIKCRWQKTILNPESKKHYIEKKQDESLSVGIVEAGMSMTCGRNSLELEIFDDEDEFLKRCKDLNINLEVY